MNEPQSWVDYIKDHVRQDLEFNRRESDEDHSVAYGELLLGYLENPTDPMAMVTGAADDYGTDKPIFLERVKCGLAIHQLWKEGDGKGLEAVRQYALELTKDYLRN